MILNLIIMINANSRSYGSCVSADHDEAMPVIGVVLKYIHTQGSSPGTYYYNLEGASSHMSCHVPVP